MPNDEETSGTFHKEKSHYSTVLQYRINNSFQRYLSDQHVSILLVTLVIDDTCCNRLDAEQVRVVDVVAQVVAAVGAATESQ